jgi:hypothetical protein
VEVLLEEDAVTDLGGGLLLALLDQESDLLPPSRGLRRAGTVELAEQVSHAARQQGVFFTQAQQLRIAQGRLDAVP